MNGEKQKFIGGVDFDELKAQRVQLYNSIKIDLATARTNKEMVFTGNYIYALEATDVDANLDIRFNELFRAAINIKKGRGVRIPFFRFYLTNIAQAGKTLTLAIGIEASDFEVFDVGKALGITGTVDVAQVGNLTRPAGSTQIVASDDCAGGIAVLHTVTALKTLYLLNANAFCHATVAGTGELFVTNAADEAQYEIAKVPLQVNVDAAVINSFHIPLEIPAGWKIKITSSDGGYSVEGFILGYEV